MPQPDPPTMTTLTGMIRELFTSHPEAVWVINHTGTVRSMAALVTGPGEAQYFILTVQDDGDPSGPFYAVTRWHEGPRFDLTAGTAEIPAWVADAVAHGVPVPRDDFPVQLGLPLPASNPEEMQ
jgi:hypothetical protein